jgi:hypothetical protein
MEVREQEREEETAFCVHPQRHGGEGFSLRLFCFVLLRSNLVLFWHNFGGRPNHRAARVSKRIFESLSP